jgi:hypothetical protein
MPFLMVNFIRVYVQWRWHIRKSNGRKMSKNLPLSIFMLFLMLSGIYGQNYLVYHERSTGSSGCGGINYLSHLQPAPADSVKITFNINSQVNAGQAVIYYTTDGSNPSGSFGGATGTTQVIPAVLGCSSGGFVNATGTVPSLPSGTIIKYIFSAWSSNGNYEFFGNSQVCTACQPILTSTNATIFTYSVQGVLPINFINFNGREGAKVIRVYWASVQESNMDRYEIYRSRNSLQFEKAGTVMAVGNSSQRTDYFFDDQQPSIGNNYYKVTAFDKTGKSVSTSIMRILFGKNDNSLVVFSNPSGDLLNVRVVDIIRGEYAIRVFENSGRLVYNGKIAHNGADAVYPVPLPQALAKGNYRLVMTNRYQFFRSAFLVD